MLCNHSRKVFISYPKSLHRYAVPLFFVCVRANVGYIVVAVFIPENDDVNSLEEALEKIKSFNPGWKPRNFLVDFAMAEITAIEKTLPSMFIVLVVLPSNTLLENV